MSRLNELTTDKKGTSGNVRAVAPDNGAADIIDAVRDQHGQYWICYGTQHRPVWFSLMELQREALTVFSRLAGPGMAFFTAASKNKFMTRIEGHENYRDALVAAHPGWVGDAYVFGDGEVASYAGDDCPIIVAFEADAKFRSQGSTDGWADAIHPLVRNQSLALFALSFGFIGPLLRYAPADLHNPLIEFVGEGGTGKSTLGILASSIWGGSPGSDVAGGESWDVTLNAIDDVRRMHNDCHLTLDEGNLLGGSQRERGDSLRTAVFKLFSTETKRRFGETGPKDHFRHATLSTTNLPLSEMVTAASPVQGALAQRMITIDTERKYGVLDRLPSGFSEAVDVIETLRGICDAEYGVAGREFVRCLQAYNTHLESDLPAKIRLRMKYYEANASGPVARSPKRVTKTFAITFAAGSLAQKCGLIPGSATKLLKVIRAIHEAVAAGENKDDGNASLGSIKNYAATNWSEMIAIKDLSNPVTESEFEATPGFWRVAGGRTELLVPSGRLQAAFPEHRMLMQTLRDGSHARTEGGKSPKLTIKAPKWVCRTGRVYWIRLPETPSQLRALSEQPD